MITNELARNLTRKPRLSCNVYKLFGDNADDLLLRKPLGYVYSPTNAKRNDPGMKIDFWGIHADPLHVPGCAIYLVKFLDGSAVSVRFQYNHTFYPPQE
jgi:hypothetical protein